MTEIIEECHLLDAPEFREGFVHRLLRCSHLSVDRIQAAGWTDVGPSTSRGYRIIASKGSLYEVRLSRTSRIWETTQ